jgi:hypothetical protein
LPGGSAHRARLLRGGAGGRGGGRGGGREWGRRAAKAAAVARRADHPAALPTGPQCRRGRRRLYRHVSRLPAAPAHAMPVSTPRGAAVCGNSQAPLQHASSSPAAAVDCYLPVRLSARPPVPPCTHPPPARPCSGGEPFWKRRDASGASVGPPSVGEGSGNPSPGRAEGSAAPAGRAGAAAPAPVPDPHPEDSVQKVVLHEYFHTVQVRLGAGAGGHSNLSVALLLQPHWHNHQSSNHHLLHRCCNHHDTATAPPPPPPPPPPPLPPCRS